VITKPRAKTAERVTQDEVDCHHWLGKLAMSLAIASHDLPRTSHARKTVDEFLSSACASAALAQIIRDEVER
jgi:hypothetical protein